MTADTSLGIHITQDGDIVFSNCEDSFTIKFTPELMKHLSLHLFLIAKIFQTRVEAHVREFMQDVEPAGAA